MWRPAGHVYKCKTTRLIGYSAPLDMSWTYNKNYTKWRHAGLSLRKATSRICLSYGARSARHGGTFAVFAYVGRTTTVKGTVSLDF